MRWSKYIVYSIITSSIGLPLFTSAKRMPSFILDDQAKHQKLSEFSNDDERDNTALDSIETSFIDDSMDEDLLMELIEKSNEFSFKNRFKKEDLENEENQPGKKSWFRIQSKKDAKKKFTKKSSEKSKPVETTAQSLQAHITNHASGIQRTECFPIEKLPAELQSAALEILDAALQSDAIHTIIGGIKPISTLSDEQVGSTLKKLNADETEQVLEALCVGQEVSFLLHKEHDQCPGIHAASTEPKSTIYIVHTKAAAQKIPAYQKVIGNANTLSTIAPHELIKKIVESPIESNSTYPTAGAMLSNSNPSSQASRIRKTHKTSSSMVVQTTSFQSTNTQQNSNTLKTSRQNTKTNQQTQNILNYYLKYIHPQVTSVGSVEALRNWFDSGNGICSTKEAYRKATEDIVPLQPDPSIS